MADNENTPLGNNEPETLVLVYLRGIEERLDGIERTLDDFAAARPWCAWREPRGGGRL